MDQYVPNAVDTSGVKLPENLEKLTEALAKNAHENWAKGRIQEGWIYGPARNDALKTTPCLLPYEQLPESEKEYDRNTAIETVKLILKLGYTIQMPKGPKQDET